MYLPTTATTTAYVIQVHTINVPGVSSIRIWYFADPFQGLQMPAGPLPGSSTWRLLLQLSITVAVHWLHLACVPCQYSWH